LTSIQLSPICVVGPTGVGKSEFAQLLAQRLHAHILSCDSMQIYRGMDIGSGKVLPEERRVVHYGLDIADPGEAFSAARFQEYGRNVLTHTDANETRLILCGGTGFWVRAIVDDYRFPAGGQLGNDIRDYWNDFALRHGDQALWEELNVRDSKSAEVIHPHNVKRVVRALEMLEEGIHYSDQLENLQILPEYRHAVWFGLSMDRAHLYERIERRVDIMVEDGLISEVETLLDNGFREAITAPQAIGYKEIVRYLDDECSLKEAIDAIKQESRRYAKRQLSWFKRDARVIWLNAEDDVEANLAFALSQLNM